MFNSYPSDAHLDAESHARMELTAKHNDSFSKDHANKSNQLTFKEAAEEDKRMWRNLLWAIASIAFALGLLCGVLVRIGVTRLL